MPHATSSSTAHENPDLTGKSLPELQKAESILRSLIAFVLSFCALTWCGLISPGSFAANARRIRRNKWRISPSAYLLATILVLLGVAEFWAAWQDPDEVPGREWTANILETAGASATFYESVFGKAIPLWVALACAAWAIGRIAGWKAPRSQRTLLTDITAFGMGLTLLVGAVILPGLEAFALQLWFFCNRHLPPTTATRVFQTIHGLVVMGILLFVFQHLGRMGWSFVTHRVLAPMKEMRARIGGVALLALVTTTLGLATGMPLFISKPSEVACARFERVMPFRVESDAVIFRFMVENRGRRSIWLKETPVKVFVWPNLGGDTPTGSHTLELESVAASPEGTKLTATEVKAGEAIIRVLTIPLAAVKICEGLMDRTPVYAAGSPGEAEKAILRVNNPGRKPSWLRIDISAFNHRMEPFVVSTLARTRSVHESH